MSYGRVSYWPNYAFYSLSVLGNPPRFSCVYTHTHTNTLTLEQLFPEKKKSKSLLIYLADLLRTLVKGRVPSAPKRSWRSHSHLHPPFFLATGNIPSYWVEGVDSEVKCHALVAGSPGAGLYTSRSLNILKNGC